MNAIIVFKTFQNYCTPTRVVTEKPKKICHYYIISRNATYTPIPWRVIELCKINNAHLGAIMHQHKVYKKCLHKEALRYTYIVTMLHLREILNCRQYCDSNATYSYIIHTENIATANIIHYTI